MNYYNVPGRKRATWHNEHEVDPFDVFTCKTVAINDYQKIELEPVSYTHLDVYKRQSQRLSSFRNEQRLSY